MSRGPRQIQPGHLTEITLKTFQARFLLKPNKLINKLLIGIFARAQKMTGMTVCAVVASGAPAGTRTTPIDAYPAGPFATL